MIKTVNSFLLTLSQFVLIVAIAWFCGVLGNPVSLGIMVAGILLGAWSLITFKFNVNIFPDVRKNQKLILVGPYRLIRHPMYSAVLMITLAWVLNRIDVLSITLWIALLVILNLKIRYEESQLIEKFPKYKEYIQRSKKLIPFVF